MRYISSENPKQDIWQLLLWYSYTDVINNYWVSKGKEENDELAFFISSSLQQAKSYYDASYNAQMNIRPLLLYYGSVNLLIGTLSLLKQKKFEINNHGMKIDKTSLQPNSDLFLTKLIPINSDGALHILLSELENITDISSRGAWSLLEIFESIPDLTYEFSNLYSSYQMHVIKIEEAETDGRKLDRIPYENIEIAKRTITGLQQDENFRNTYMPPQTTKKYIILNRIPETETYETFSLTEERFLPIPYTNKGNIYLPQYIMIFKGLFILGSLSRYNPEIWDQFIRFDSTGRKNIIDKFLYIAERYLPNLILNKIYDEKVVFTK